MLALRIEEIEADGARLRSFGPDAVADRLLCVDWYKALQLGLSSLVLEMGRPRPQEDRRKLCPSVGAAHIDDSNCLDARLRRIDTKQARRLAAFDTPPELAFGGDD
jgi:hypothetical protein